MKYVTYKWGQPSNWSWSDEILIGFDLETTSASPLEAKILSASVIVDTPGKEPTVYEWLLNQTPIPIGATAIHGITEEKVIKDGIDPTVGIRGIVKVLTQLKKDYPAVPLVIVNANYDCTVLSMEMRRHIGFPLAIENLPYIVDSLTLDRMADPWRRGRRTLSASLAAYNLNIIGAHTATGDVLAGIKLIRAIGKRYPEIGRASLPRLQLMQKEAHMLWCEQYEQYRRMENPDFMIGSKKWPIIEVED